MLDPNESTLVGEAKQYYLLLQIGVEFCVLFGPSYTSPVGESDCYHLLPPGEAQKISSISSLLTTPSWKAPPVSAGLGIED